MPSRYSVSTLANASARRVLKGFKGLLSSLPALALQPSTPLTTQLSEARERALSRTAQLLLSYPALAAFGMGSRASLMQIK